MFAKITNNQVVKYPYTVGDLRRDNPNTSFPKKVPETTMAAFGMMPVTHADAPSYDPMTQRIEHSSQPVFQDGSWVITKTVVALTADEITAKNERAAIDMRRVRDDLLAETDWWASSDLTMTAEQTAYRQALRDITTNSNWPNLTSSDWPVKP
jgi:hypothetical protein